jgi:hypothetical protein
MKLKKKALKDFNQVVSARTALGVLTKGNKRFSCKSTSSKVCPRKSRAAVDPAVFSQK